MSIWQKLKSWFSDTSRPRVLQAIPRERVFFTRAGAGTGGDAPILADRSYLRVWLVEMRLAKSRNWFKDYQPAVHSTATLQFADRSIELTRVAAPKSDAFAADRAVLRNYPLLDLVPFRGGTLTLDAALIAVKGDDHLARAITALSSFAELVAAPLATALAVADKVKQGADLLLDEDGDVMLGYHNQHGGGGGANTLLPGYVAVVQADARAHDWSRLFVRDDELWFGDGNDVGRISNYDYMLLRVESLASRDDLHHFTDLERLREQTLSAYLRGNTEEGETSLRLAMATIATHPDLINSDRRAVMKALRDEIAEYRDPTRGATPPPAAPAWAALVEGLPPAKDDAPITAAELDALLAR
jgi:hypothetical protein